MTAGLFRQQVLDAKRGSWLGAINVATPMSRWLWAALGIALAGAIVAFLILGHYTRRNRVIGQLVPNTGLLSTTANTTGTVTRLYVHQGDRVRKGDPLLEISSERDSTRLGSLHADISRQLRSQRHKLTQDLATARKRHASQLAALKNKQTLLRAQQAQSRAQETLVQQQVADAQAMLARFEPLLAKGYVSALRVQQQKTTVLQARTQLTALRRQQLDIRQQLNATAKQLQQLPLDLASQSRAIDRQIGDIEQRLAQNEAARARILHAPRDGVVSTLLARLGQHVVPGQSLASLVPQGSTLVAELLVPSRAVGFVRPGSQVVLRYQAYPYQKFGQQYGQVARISRSALSPAEVVALTGKASQVPLYRVTVALQQQSILAYGKAQALKPGMALSADILMDRRSLLEWVFEPLYGIRRDLQGAAHG